jgi:hypothetical protein
MRRLIAVCVTLACVVMLVGGEGSRKLSRCHGLYGVAWVCNAQAAVNPQAFGIYWAHQFDKAAYKLHRPWRIIAIGCRNEGEAVYVCAATMRNVRTHATLCVGLAIGSSGQVLDATHERCGAAA